MPFAHHVETPCFHTSMVIGTFNAPHVDSNPTVPLRTTTVLDGLISNKAQAPSTTLESAGALPLKPCLAKDQQVELHSLQLMFAKMAENEPTSDSKAKAAAKVDAHATHLVADCLLEGYPGKSALKNSERSLLSTAT
jgi:hypothetical protein